MPISILWGKIKETSWFRTGRKSQKEEYGRKGRLRGIINAEANPFKSFQLPNASYKYHRHLTCPVVPCNIASL